MAAASPAQHAGLQVGDELVSIDGNVPRDVIEYRLLVDEADPELEVRRGHEILTVALAKEAGEPAGIEVSSAVFDRVRTCDNHCEFCFIYQLPKGMRRSLYLKDDDYRLSFLYGNFTTLTRFTELDLERVLSERLSPLFVSIHTTDPELRARMLRNPRGAVSLRWLRALLDGGIEVHGQVVVCPGVNDGAALEATLAGIIDQYPELATVACVPLGVSAHTKEPAMRAHSTSEAAAVIDTVEEWQRLCLEVLGRRMFFAADEYYLLAQRPFPSARSYEGFPQHENGIGMARAFEAAFRGDRASAIGVRAGFFAAVDGAPAAGYRAPRASAAGVAPDHEGTGTSAVTPDGSQHGGVGRGAPGRHPVFVITGEYGATVLGPLLDSAGSTDVHLLPVPNRFFGGNIAVTGLLTGTDIAQTLAEAPREARYLLPDVCLSEGRFLDGTTVTDLPRAVEVVPSDGWSLRAALGATRATTTSVPVPTRVALRTGA